VCVRVCVCVWRAWGVAVRDVVVRAARVLCTRTQSCAMPSHGSLLVHARVRHSHRHLHAMAHTTAHTRTHTHAHTHTQQTLRGVRCAATTAMSRSRPCRSPSRR
jgi:hypothetical protein